MYVCQVTLSQQCEVIEYKYIQDNNGKHDWELFASNRKIDLTKYGGQFHLKILNVFG